jgi:aarF domain-containing kinase
MNQLQFFKEKLAEKFPMIIIPEVYPEYCTEQILTMEWVEGDSFSDSQNYTQEEKDFLGTSLYESFLYCLWELKRLHTDPQYGNYLFKRNKIIILDFGSTRNFDHEFIIDYAALIMALEQDRLDIYKIVGKKVALFKQDEESAVIQRHYEMLRVLYKPYTLEGVQGITEINPFNLLKDFIKDIDFKGRKSPRNEFILLDRSNFGLYTKLKAWGSQINWLKGRNKFRNSIENEVKLFYPF